MATDHAIAKQHREWLRGLPGLTGKSLSRIADEAKIARTTLTKKLQSGDSGIETLNASTIERIVRQHRVPGPGGATMPPGLHLPGLAEDATPYNPEKHDELGAAIDALTDGRDGIDPWTIKTRALELAGFLPGDVVLVDLNAAPQPGQAVCAQVYDWPRMKAETVMRIFQRASAVDVLVASSSDPSFGAPILVDGERVVIKGVLLPHRLRP